MGHMVKGMFSSLLSAGLLSLACAGTASAVSLPWDNSAFTDGSVDNGDTVTAGGITATFDNIVAPGSAIYGTSDVDGIFFGDRVPFELNGYFYPQQAVTSFDLTFDKNVVINSYTVSFVTSPVPAVATFALSGAGGATGDNSATVTGSFSFNAGTLPVFLAGQTYDLSTVFTEGAGSVTGDFFQVKSLDITEVPNIPLPASLLLLTCALGGLGIARRRRG